MLSRLHQYRGAFSRLKSGFVFYPNKNKYANPILIVYYVQDDSEGR